jgi:SAM-dependent methyltransferase
MRCRACGAGDLSHRFEVAGCAIQECPRCRSLITDVSMDGPQSSRFYAHGYFHGGDYLDYEAAEPITKRNFVRFAQRLRAVSDRGALLELGSAYGYFLDVAARSWDVQGVDISEEATSAAAQRFGPRVHCGDLLTLPLPDSGFDWVVAWDTIEHLDRPRDYVRRSLELLKSGGHLALTTGDESSRLARLRGRRWRLMTPPSHLTFFSRAGMRAMLEDAGFVNIDFSTTGYDRSLAFALFRLLGATGFERLEKGLPRVASLLARPFYLNLGDIMFVTAGRP